MRFDVFAIASTDCIMGVMNTFIRQSGRHRQRNTDIYREIQY